MALLAPEITRAVSAIDKDDVKDNFDPIPEGTYTAQISSVEIKDTKAGTGKYLKVALQITGPAYQGRLVFDNINVKNPNEEAVQIGIKTLKKIALAIGEDTIQDTDQMLGANVEIKVKVKIDKTGQYDPQNEVKDYKPIGNAPVTGPISKPASKPHSNGFDHSAPTPPPPADTGGATPPWMRV
jgi:hypothetical protein